MDEGLRFKAVSNQVFKGGNERLKSAGSMEAF